MTSGIGATRLSHSAYKLVRRILFVSIAFGVVALAAVSMMSYWPHEVAPLRRLADGAWTSTREIEPRLTGGFRWAPLRAAKRGDDDGLDADRLTLAAIAGKTIQTSPEDRHAGGVARLMLGHARAAASMLDDIAAPDAAVWSDLAAARYTIAVRENDPAQLPRALAAADAALRLNPNLAEARFNRAFVIERLGLRDQAREQWDAYLAVDGGSAWANEARQHVRQLQPIAPFKEELERAYERLASDAEAVHAFARQYRQESRLWGETEILGRWATAERDGNHELAMKHLRIARELGAELARDRGDQMLRSLVGAIDRADAEQRRALVEAHLAFREGQKTYQQDRPVDAEKILLRAADAFNRGGSSGALLARYFAANTAYSQGRIPESRKALERLLADSPPDLVAHRAQVLWQIGLVDLAEAEWGTCIDTLTESVATFERLDERMYAATVRQILATAYERIGNRSASWKHRMIALKDLARRPTTHVEIMLRQLAVNAAANGDLPEAVSLFSLAIDAARRVDDPPTEVQTLTSRATLHLRVNDRAAAATDLRNARSLLQRITEPSYRRLLEAYISEVEAVASPNPAVTVEALTRAIEFHRTQGFRMWLPHLMLERGRALLAMNDEKRARADFESGIAELESRRETLSRGEDRWEIFHDADELFAAAIALSLKHRETERAFRYAERARARALLEALGAWPSVTLDNIPAGTTIVEYAIQPKSIVTFVIDSQGVRAVEQTVDRATLAGEIADLRHAAMQSDRVALRRAGRVLYRRLIEPVEPLLTSSRKLVFVPDPRLEGIPFAALVDGSGKYLIATHAIAMSPSAAVHAQLAKASRARTFRNAIVVTGGEDLGTLAAVEGEAAAVSACYRHGDRLTRELATIEAFRQRAPSADVIHFAGHAAESTDVEGGGHLLLTNGRLHAREIASLHLPRTSIVVLAACGTGAGEIRSTEGTISLARAFLAASVPSVVGTLWSIEDGDAAEFFPLVHRNLARGLPPAEAVRAAQIEYIEKPRSSIRLWSGVQVLGN
jgi:CHAT domain-containing protein